MFNANAKVSLGEAASAECTAAIGLFYSAEATISWDSNIVTIKMLQWVDKSLSDSDFPVIPPSNLIYCMTHNFTTSRVIAILSSAIDFLGKIGLMQLFNTLYTNLALLRLHLPFFASPLPAYLASLQPRTPKPLAHTL